VNRQRLSFACVLFVSGAALTAAQTPQAASSAYAATSSDCALGPSPTGPEFRFVPAYGSNPWPLELTVDTSSSEIKAIEHGTHGVVSGFTRPVPDVSGAAHLSPTVTIEWTLLPAKSDGGSCAYVSAVHIRHPTIQMLIASEYAPTSCNFAETRKHETLHYVDLSASLRKSQQRIKAAVQRIDFPTPSKPWHLQRDARVAPMSDDRKRLGLVVQIAIQRIIDDIDREAVAQGQRRDEPHLIDAVYSKCDSWLETPVKVAKASLR